MSLGKSCLAILPNTLRIIDIVWYLVICWSFIKPKIIGGQHHRNEGSVSPEYPA